MPRPQFTLRVLLIALTVGCLWLGWRGELAKRQRDAVHAIELAKGWVLYDYAARRGSTPVGPRWLREFIGEDFFRSVVAADFTGVHPGLNDDDVMHLERYLRGLPRLRAIHLGHTRLTDVGTRYIAGVAQIEELSLNAADLTDAGLEPLKRLSHLTSLTLVAPSTTETGVIRLAQALPRCHIDY